MVAEPVQRGAPAGQPRGGIADPRPERLAQRPRDPRPDARVALARSRGGARPRARRGPSRRRAAGRRRRRGRGAGRRRACASNRASSAGRSQAASDARSSGRTRAVRCRRNWRPLRAHQDIGRRRRSGCPSGRLRSRTTPRTMKIPYWFRNGRTCHAWRGDSTRYRSVEPSSGGTGRKLKIASVTLIQDEQVQDVAEQRQVERRRCARSSTPTPSSRRNTRAAGDRHEEVRGRAGERDDHLAVAPVAQVRRVDRASASPSR